MEKWEQYFKGKKTTVMGLGLLGRGVGDTEFLAECGADLIVTDLKTEEQLQDSLARLKEFSNIRFTLGEHKLEDFENRDMVLVAAGVPFDSPYILHAKEQGIELIQSAALFAKLSGVPMVGVTGTRGKSTTTAMIAHIIETATGEKVIKGGNVRGVSNLQLLKEVKEDSLAVFELDSWQMQGFGWAKISPQVAVFTNFMEDHMNYYRGDMDAYFADKANIFINQDESGVLVTTPEVFERAKEFAEGKSMTLGQEVVLADASIIAEEVLLKVPGEHNRLNAALAVSACRATGLNDEEIFSALSSFEAVDGRLQLIKTTDNGVKIYNDNNSTTPQATIAGLKAVATQKNVILIAGGADKNIDTKKMIETIEKYCKKVVLLPGTGTDKMKPNLPYSIIEDRIKSMEEAVKEAFNSADSGDVILFSPGFASFGLFKNEYDRNDKFVAAVEECLV